MCMWEFSVCIYKNILYDGPLNLALLEISFRFTLTYCKELRYSVADENLQLKQVSYTCSAWSYAWNSFFFETKCYLLQRTLFNCFTSKWLTGKRLISDQILLRQLVCGTDAISCLSSKKLIQNTSLICHTTE